MPGSSSAPRAVLPWLLVMPLVAQEPSVAPATPTEPAPAAPPAEPAPKPPVLAIAARWIHPVAGPTIENGLVLVTGDRITAIGPRDAVAVPADAQRFDYPQGHLYPGLIDALTDAYTDAGIRGDGSLDAGNELAPGLRLRGDRDDELLAAGITTAWVGCRAPSTWRGQGAIVRPQQGRVEVWRDRGIGAVLMRLTAGLGGGHALQRQQLLEGLVRAFDGLDTYKKAFDDHKKALDKYTADYEAYLSFYRKKKEGDKPASPPAGTTPPPPPTNPPAPGGDRPRGRRGEGGGRGNQGNGGGALPDPAVPTDAAQDPKPEPSKSEPPKQDPAPAANTAKPDDKPPAKPEYPKAPARDPAKEALTKVLDGALALRIEAIRPDEIRAALAMARTRKIPLLILEQAYGAAAVAAELANAGVTCVLTEILPASLPPQTDTLDPTGVPAQLQAQGVPFAIATGSARRAGLLPLMAATAVGAGLDPEAALRAITLTPAELLGIAKDTGSLQAGKLADMIVTDKPLFASDARVLRVLSAGATTWEAK